MEDRENIDEILEDEEIDGSNEPAAEDEPEADEPEVAGEGEDDGGEDGEDQNGEGEVAPKAEPPKKSQRELELEGELAEEREKNSKAAADLDRLMKALGYDDVDSYLAEQEGISREEFIEKRRDAEILAQAKAQASSAKYERMMAEDLAALKSAGLIDSTVQSIRDIENVKRFAELRDLGLSAVEAYRAASGTKLDSRIEQRARRAATGKEHLTTPKSRGSAGHGSTMSRSERAYYRELLGTDDDKAIEAAYKRAKGQ